MSITVSQLVAKISTQGALEAKAQLQGVGMASDMAGGSLNLLAAGGIAAAGAALIGLGAKAVQMAGNFQESMTQLVTGAGESRANLKTVSDGILDMAVKTATPTKQLADGMYMIESAGYHGADGLKVLTAAAEGAKVGNADLASVANGVTTALTDYALPASKATEVTNDLIATVAAGKTKMADLSSAMSTILPTSASVGVSLSDTSAAMATMTGEGTNAASAATYLRQLLMALVNPAQKGADALAEIGLTSTDVSDAMKQSLPGALQMITDHLKNKFPEGSAAYVAALADISGGSRQMQGMLELTGTHLQTLQNNVDSITGAVKKGGNEVRGWAEVQQDFNFKFQQAKEVVEKFGIAIGTKLLPVVGKVLGFFVDLAQGAGEWLKKLYARIEPVIKAVTDWAEKNHILEKAMKLLQDRIEFALLPLRFLWNIVTFLIDKFKQWEEKYHFVEKATKLVTDVLSKLHDLLEKVKKKVQDQVDWFKKWVESFHLVQHVSEALDFIVGKLHDIIHALKEKIKEAIDRFQAWEERHHVVQRAAEALHTVVQKVHDLLERLRDKIKQLVDRFNDWTAQHHVVQQAADALHTVISKLHDIIKNVIEKVKEAITNFHNWEQSHHVVQSASETLHTVLSKLHDLVHNIKEKIKEAIKQFQDWEDKHHLVQKAAETLYTAVKNLHDIVFMLRDKIRLLIERFIYWEMRHHAVKRAAELLQGALSNLYGIIHTIFEKVKEGITRFYDWEQSHHLVQRAAETLHVILGKLYDIIKNVIVLVGHIIAGFFEWNAKAQPLITVLQALEGIAANVARGLRGLAVAAIAVLLPFGQIWQLFVNNLQPAWNDFTKALGPFKQSLLDLYAALLPILEVLGGIVLFLGVLNFGEVLANIRGLANGIANSIGFIIGIFTGLIEFWTGMATTVGGIVKLLVDFVTGHWDRLGKDTEQIWKGIQMIIGGAWQVISNIVGGIIMFIVGLVSGFVSGIIDFFKFLYDKLIGHSIVVDLANGLRDWFQRAWDWITGIFKGIGQWFGDRFNDIKNFFADLPGNLRNTAQDAWNKITGVFSGLSDWVHDHVWQPMADGLGNALSGVADTVSGAFNNIGGAIKWGINNVIDDVNGIINNINSVSTKIGVPAISNIPHLAKGTDYFQGGLALVGEIGPELVNLPRGAQIIPNNQIGSYLPAGAQVAPQSAQQTIHVHVTVQPNDLVVDGQRFTNKMMPHVVNAIRDRTGHRSF